MILVLLGTQDKSFNRLLDEISKLKKNRIIKDRVIVQSGSTKCNYNNLECFKFLPQEDLKELILKAKYIISHAGVGTILECLEKNKKIIVAPRLKKYKEHTNDHQIQITKEFAHRGYIIPLYNINKLENAISSINDFKPKKYTSNNDKFKEMIKGYIDIL